MNWDFLLDPFKYLQIPFGAWTQSALDWSVGAFREDLIGIFAPVQVIFQFLQSSLMQLSPAVALLLAAVAGIAFLGIRFGFLLTLFVYLIVAMGIWSDALMTLSIVITAVSLCVLVGLPLGVAASKSDRLWGLLRPVLDLLQTIPSFVYLIPIAMFFGIGNFPGILVTCFYAAPPLIRLTNLGIRGVDREAVEAARSFGSSPLQTLFKIEMPMARPTIVAGITQSVMMALNMTVIASMIAVAGLGRTVLAGLGRLDVGAAAVGGLGIVLLAIMIDRLFHVLARSRREKERLPWYELGVLQLVRRRGGRSR